jgi:hypothetical protein
MRTITTCLDRHPDQPQDSLQDRHQDRLQDQPQGHHLDLLLGRHRGPPRDRLRDHRQELLEDQPQRNRSLRRTEGTPHYSHRMRTTYFWRFHATSTGRNN